MQHSTNSERLAVRLSLCMMATAMLLLSRDFSMSGDEASQIQIGRNIYVYLCRTLGFLPGNTHLIKLDNYSGLFGVVTTNLSHWMPWWDEIHLRHFVIAITGFFAIVYAGKAANLLWGRTAQLITIWLLFCSPRFFGASMNDSKDIPFALGMMVTAYFLLRILYAAPIIEKGAFTGLFFGLFIAIGIRIGGLPFCGIYAVLVFAYLALQHWRSNRAYVLRLGGWMIAAGLAAFLAAIIFLPKVWPSIPLNTLRALQNFSNYHVALTMLYQGRDLPTTQPPWHYLPLWIGITVPAVLLALLLFTPLLFWRAKHSWQGALLLLTMVLLPWLLIVVNHSPVYDAWRQFYFIYPPMVVLAGGVAARIWAMLERPAAEFAFSAMLIAGLLPPVLWSIRNHPLENVYFNEVAGGLPGAYGHYETDYYGESIQLACKKLLAQPAFAIPQNDSVYVVDNVPTQIIHYLKAANPRISIHHLPYEARDSTRWQWGIFATRGLDSLLKRRDWPPAGMVDSVSADGVLLMAIVKRQ